MKRLKKKEILVLRSCGENGRAYNGFMWPLGVRSVVESPDWDGRDSCGGGLHGNPWGEGGNYSQPSDPVWMVLRVDTSPDNYQHGTGKMTDKCKFKKCIIEGVFNNPKDATDMILKYAPAGTVCNYSQTTAGNYGTATAGCYGTATAGDEGTATAGRYGTATAGDEGTATAGDEGTVIIKGWNGKRYKFIIGYIGEDGLEANTPYQLDDENKFVKALEE